MREFFSSQLLLINGKSDEKQINEVSLSLINPLINRVHFKNQTKYLRDNGMDKIVPQVKLTSANQVDKVDLNVTDEELTIIGKSGIKNKDGSLTRGPLAPIFYI